MNILPAKSRFTHHLDDDGAFMMTATGGDIVSHATIEFEREEIESHKTLNHKLSWRFRAAGRIKMAHTPRKPGEAILAGNRDAVY